MNKFWKFIILLAPILSTFEGVEHYVVSSIAIVGLICKHEFTFFAWFTPIWDYLMGTISILIGFAIKKYGDKLVK